MEKLFVYPNCSKGGVSTVIRGRARSEPATHFSAVFFNDKGGRLAFEDLDNVSVRVVRKDRSDSYLQYVSEAFSFDEVSVLSSPQTANKLLEVSPVPICYEFHSSNKTILEREVGELNLNGVTRFFVPSEYMRSVMTQILPKRVHARLEVRPNLVDREIFKADGPADFLEKSRFAGDRSSVPLLWVGRFDLQKGYSYFLRALAQLPEFYVGHIVVSLEDDPSRAAAFFAECAELGLSNRVRLYLNLPQKQMANMMRSIRVAGGAFVSTSLMESFGYSIAESLACELPVFAFQLPVLQEFEGHGEIRSCRIGSVQDLASELMTLSRIER